jgi:hypothetical protein
LHGRLAQADPFGKTTVALGGLFDVVGGVGDGVGCVGVDCSVRGELPHAASTQASRRAHADARSRVCMTCLPGHRDDPPRPEISLRPNELRANRHQTKGER